MIAQPAAWRLAPVAPPERAADDESLEHAHLIAKGLPRGVGDLEVTAVDGAVRSRWDRSRVHEHDAAELNLILPVTPLTCEVVLGDERYDVAGPASIVVPAGLAHSVNVKSGTGFLVAIPLERSS